jgi:ATP-dependent DNA ligase
MLSTSATEIPRGAGWTYEPKWDGFRTIVVSEGASPLALWSREGRPLGRYFPELADLSVRPGERFVADGEILRVHPGKMDFDELQLRLHPAASRVRKLAAEIPATLILFDLLRTPDGTLLDEPLAERRRALDALAERLGLVRAPDELRSFPEGPGLLVAPWSRDDALADRWFADDAGIGQDGVVAKREDQPYLPGERGWVKIKHRRTVDCVVGGYRLSKAGDGVGSLLLGLYDPEGALHYVGHTSSFRAAERRELLAELEPLRTDESFAGGRTPGGPSRWSGGRDLEWVTIAPSRVCEVSVDRLQSGRFRHAATFQRWRPDREPRSCGFEQLDPGADRAARPGDR